MSSAQYVDCSRSVSDGDLSGSDKKQRHSSGKENVLDRSIEKQTFFTLPRWMSVRKKRNRSKYIKVDVPFTSSDRTNHYDETEKEKKSSNFIRKLLRSSSFFTNGNSHRSDKIVPRSPTIPIMSTSNSDVRNCNDFNFHSFDYHDYFKDKNPAVCGIKNHGNTCFMNAVIQCLSNTDVFAEYFVMGHFKMDLLRRNKTHSKKYGTRGEVTEQLGALLTSLWTCQYYPNISNKFRNLVAKYGEQYDGSDQHDAQEFLLWLLDKVHEDLNIAPKQKYKKSKGNIGRTDEDIAAETLANHLRCNSSFIHDLFQGQFRSSLCCLGCGRFSNTFDPYLCVSLPVPHCQTIPFFLYVAAQNKKILSKVGITIESQATVIDLREKLNSSFGISKKNVVLTEIIKGDFKRTFQDLDTVSRFGESENVFAIETPLQDLNVSVEQEKVVLIVINKIEDDTGGEMLWRPFSISIHRECSYIELENEIFSAMNHVFKDNFSVNSDSFSISVVAGETNSEKICSSVDMPLYMPIIDKALLLNADGFPHIKLCIQWKKEVKDMLQTELSVTEEHSSVEEVMLFKKSSDKVSLYECFDLYFNEERLGVEDARMCPYCHHRLPCVKTLNLWTIPDILIVHLKRFRQSSSQRMKTTAFVDFPYAGLDMNPYVAERNHSNSQQMPSNSLTPMALWSPWKRSRSHLYSRWDDNVYELYGVCSHHGSMQAGHYTAYCRNPVSGHWFLYDDTKVQEVPAKEVVSTDAYILFYQRSSLSSLSCASSSSSGYSSASSANSVGPDHWAFRMSPLFQDVQITSKSQDNLFDYGKTSSLDRRSSLHRPFNRSAKAYTSTIHHNGTKTLPHSHIRASSSNTDQQNSKEVGSNEKEEIPPPPPPAKHYWTVTSV